MIHSVQQGIRQRIRKFTSIYSNSSTTSLSAVAKEVESQATEDIKWAYFKKFGQRRTKSTASIDASNGHSTTSSSSETAGPNGTATAGVSSQSIGTKVSLPSADREVEQTITLKASDGETLIIKDQVQLYAPNNLLGHPLVSAALGHLGNLPPLLIIAGNDEVLRDEVLYM